MTDWRKSSTCYEDTREPISHVYNRNSIISRTHINPYRTHPHITWFCADSGKEKRLRPAVFKMNLCIVLMLVALQTALLSSHPLSEEFDQVPYIQDGDTKLQLLDDLDREVSKELERLDDYADLKREVSEEPGRLDDADLKRKVGEKPEQLDNNANLEKEVGGKPERLDDDVDLEKEVAGEEPVRLDEDSYCFDKYHYACPRFARNGFCGASGVNKFFMEQYCKKSCGFCGKNPGKRNTLDSPEDEEHKAIEDNENFADLLKKIDQDKERFVKNIDLDFSEDESEDKEEYKAEENLNNSNMLEGDIKMDESTTKIIENLQSDARDAITNPVRHWPGGRVPYVFGTSSARVKSAFRAAIAEYNKYTCIRIVPRRSERNYVYVVSESGCWSSIGRSGGRQKLSLGRGCEHKGTAVHELMHALGFFHEQSRRDRDNYITIMWNNIIPRFRYNFEKYRHGQADTLNEPYDYKSIMHYPKHAFSKNRQPTIVTKKSGVKIGQRSGLSRIDIRQVNKLYKCGSVKPKPTRLPVVSCIDRFSGCPRWAKAKYCVSGKYVSWMRKNCRKSCRICGKPVRPICVDRKKSSCIAWNRMGFCKNKRFLVYMKLNCAKTCKAC